MKYFIILTIAFAAQTLTAQTKYAVGIQSYTYLDSPASIIQPASSNLLGSGMNAKLNFGNTIELECISTFKDQFSLEAAFGYGVTQLRFNLISTQEFKDNPFEKDIINEYSESESRFVYLKTEMSTFINLKSGYRIAATIGGSLINVIWNNQKLGSSALVEQDSEYILYEFYEGEYFVNRNQRLLPAINPGIDISKRFFNFPLRIKLGIAALITTKNIINGEVTFYGNNENYNISFSDKMKSIGITCGLTYDLN